MKLLRSKKGTNIFPVLIAVILMVILLIILIYMLYKIGANADQQAMNSRCRTSILAYAKLKTMPVPKFVSGGVAKESEIDCPTQYVTIDKKKPNDQRRQIADMMAQCWANFGAGKLTLFSEGRKFCHICSVFQFEDKSQGLAGLPYYIMTQRVNWKVNGRYMTYQEYFSRKMPEQKDLDELMKQDISYFAGGQRYAVVFTYFKAEEMSAFKKFVIAGAIGAAGIGLAVGIAVITGGTGVAASATVLAKAAAIGSAIMTVGQSATVGAIVFGGLAASTGSDTSVPQASLVLIPYDTQRIKQLGCEELPVSQMDKEFR